MIDTKLGPWDRTVGIFIDRAYPVVKAVYLKLEEITSVYEKLDVIESVHDNLDQIQNVQDAALSLSKINENLDAVLEVQDNLDIIKELLEHIDLVQEAVENIGVYFTPSVDDDGNLSWTNNGGLENPETVNIKGEKGDSLQPDYLGVHTERELYDDEPKGTSFFDMTHGCYYFKLSDESGKWSKPHFLHGPSANEILMKPDPEKYWLFLYGQTDGGDVVGSIDYQILEPVLDPDPTTIFEEQLA